MIRKVLLIFMGGLCFAGRSFSQCAQLQSVTVTPAPGAGNTYTDGEIVTFCYTLDGFTQNNSNWFHGLTIKFGPGWDSTTLTVISVPNPASGVGSWAYYPNGETGYHSPQQHFGAGFYFGTNAGAVHGTFAADTDNPGENYGDYCVSGNCTWTFCFSIEVNPNAAPGTSLELQVIASGDGTSGSWTDAGCGGTPYTLSTATVAIPVLSANAKSANVMCFDSCNGIAVVTATHGTVPYTYKWNTSPQQTTDSISHLCPGTYVCTVTDAAHTTATASVNITQPTALAYTDSLINPACHGACTGAILVNVSGGMLPYNYSWSAGAAPNASADYAVCAGNVNLTVSDSNHCSITESFTLIDPTADSIQLISQTNVACRGAHTGLLTVSASGGAGNYKFHWSNAKTGTSDTLLAAATYKVTVTDTVGCNATASYIITQPATAVVIDSPNITNINCFGLHDGAITAKATGGTGSLNYNWEEASTGAVFSGQTISDLAADTYNLTVIDSADCWANASYQLNNPLQLIIDSLGYSQPACYGASNGNAYIVTRGGTGTLHYSWNGGAMGLADSLNNVSSGMLRVNVTDSNNCNLSDSIFVSQPTPLNIILINQENVLCHGQSNGSLTISATGGTPGYTYLWNNSQAGTMDTALSVGSDSITVSDANSCSLVQTFQISQTSTLAASPFVINSRCFDGADGSVNANPTGGVAPYSFLWSNSQSVQEAHNLAAGDYSCTVTDGNGCTVLAIDSVGQPPALIIFDSAIAVKCSGQNTGSIVVNATGGVPPYDFSATQDETNFNFSHGGIITGLDTGTWFVYLSDMNGCTIDTPVYVPDATLDVFNISTDSTLCYGLAYSDGAITVTVVSLQNAPYQFSIDGDALQNTGYFSGLVAGPHLVMAINANGCTDSLSDTVRQPLPISISANPDTLVIALGQGQIVNITYANIDNPVFNWEPTEGLSCFDCATPVMSPYISGPYTVTASRQIGDATCSADATVYVEVIPQRQVYIPNVFSPNGDGNNDRFQVYGDNMQYVEMKIFNRWGELVFASTNQYNGWDGTYKGKIQDPGVFVYQAVVTFLDGTQTSMNGTVTLLR